MKVISEVIRKEGNEIVLYSSDGSKVLGRFPFGKGRRYKDEEGAREAAKKRERQVQFFKHQGEALREGLARLLEEKRHHNADWKSCVEQVGEGKYNPYAVCTAAFNKAGRSIWEAAQGGALQEGEKGKVVEVTLDDAWELMPPLAAQMELQNISALQIDMKTWEITEIPGEGEAKEVARADVERVLVRGGVLAAGAVQYTEGEAALVDRITGYLEALQAGNLTPSEAEEMAALGILVQPTAEAVDLQKKIDIVWQAWNALYPWRSVGPAEPASPPPPCISQVFDTYIIVQDGEAFYQVNYISTETGLVFEDRAKWIRVEQVWVPAQAAPAVGEAAMVESVANLEILGRFLERKPDGDGAYPCIVIEAGESLNKRRYKPEVLQAAVPVFENAQMYIDHPARSEEKDRPERSVRDLAGRLRGVHWDDASKSLLGRAYISDAVPWLRALVEDGTAGDVSINASGTGRKDQAGVFDVEAINVVNSVDFVTRAGAGGRILEAMDLAMIPTQVLIPAQVVTWESISLESLSEHRPDILNEIASREKDKLYRGKEETLREAQVAPALRAELESKQTRILELERQLGEHAVADVVEQLLSAEAGLPEAAKVEVRRQVAGCTLADAPTRTKEAIQALKNVTAQILEAGRVRGHGATTGGGEEADRRLAEAYIAAGLTPEQAAIAARGRM